MRAAMIAFEKWQGLGNDFIVVRGADPGPEQAVRLCDRRRGIGGDGVLAVSEHERGVRMVVRNADGSRPEMCGNGVRCVVGFVARARRLERGALTVISDAGERECAFEREASGAFVVTVSMGSASVVGPLSAPSIPGHAFLRVDVGNPHAVSFDPFDDADLDRIGPAIERATPGGINVELCRTVGSNRIEVLVWERGVGRTLACGTGACAVAAAAVATGRARSGEPVSIALPGGALDIVVDGATGTVSMRGPAEQVFHGEFRGAPSRP